MLALHPRVVDVVWAAVEPRLPEVVDEHPLGCHRRRRSDREIFEAILFRLVTGCSWDVAGRLGKGSETTLRRRRDEWLAAGVFDELIDEALDGYDRIIGLDLSDVAVDGSLHKAPFGGEGTGPSPLTGANAAGSGRSPPTATASRSAGRSPAPTATTPSCSPRHSTASMAAACSARSTPCISTAATTTRSSATSSPTAASPTSSAPSVDPPAPRRAPNECRWGCVGRSNGPTRG